MKTFSGFSGMQVKNIECQIAQAQLRRYLTGEEMPNAIVTDLETHLRHCPECMAAAQTLRESLKGVLNGKITGKPVKQEPKAPAPKAVVSNQEPVQSPADILDAPDSQFKPTKAPKKSNAKTLLYSGALALVLVLMSTVFKDPTKLFGPRAASVPSDTPPQVAPSANSTDTDTAVTETDVAETGDGPAATDTVAGTAVTPDPAATTGVNAEMPTTSKPLETSGLIVADGVSGTTQIKPEPKPQPKAKPKAQPKKRPTNRRGGVGTIKVYPPIK
jgi:hypothetical protein